MCYVSASHGGDCIYRLRFLDHQGNAILSYNPYNLYDKSTVYKIEEGELIVGVYGVRGQDSPSFDSFGFIVAARKNKDETDVGATSE